MTQTHRLKPGTQKLSETARHIILPEGIVSTAWPAVEARCAKFGVNFDAWQIGAGRSLLALNSQGQYAADTTVLSIPRQVGKTFLLGSVVFALCMIHPGMTVIWTAHHSRTANETFDSMQAMARLPKVAPSINTIRRAANEQAVRFANGSRILFGAREHGFGRGFTGVDILVFDEAQKLSERAMDNMVPTTNQASTGNPLILLAGTPPRPGIDEGDVFGKLRNEAIESGTGNGNTLYIEFSADADADPSDRKQWAKANPSYPHRTPSKAMLRMFKHLGSASFGREALGIWDDAKAAARLVEPGVWENLTGPTPTDGRIAYGVRFSADGSRMAIAVAETCDDGRPFVEVLESASTSVGLANVTKWLAERWRDADSIVIDGKSMAGLLTEELIAAGVQRRRLVRPTFEGIITLSAHLIELIKLGDITHAGQPGLSRAVSAAGRRPIGHQGGWGFLALEEDADIPGMEAVALAVSGLKNRGRRPKDDNSNTRGTSGGRRKAKVM